MSHGRKLAVIGLGYVGLPVAIAFARQGTPIIGFDIDEARIAELKAGQDLLTRDVAKTPEAKVSEAKPVEPRPTKLGAPPRPLGTLVTPAPVHRPRPPAYPPAQAAYVPPPPPAATPVQIAPPPPVNNTDPVPVVRPPMPVQQ